MEYSSQLSSYNLIRLYIYRIKLMYIYMILKKALINYAPCNSENKLYFWQPVAQATSNFKQSFCKGVLLLVISHSLNLALYYCYRMPLTSSKIFSNGEYLLGNNLPFACNVLLSGCSCFKQMQSSIPYLL